MSGEHKDEFYTREERLALERLGSRRGPDPGLEDRIVGVLERRGLLEPREEEVRGGSRLGAMVLAFLKPAAIGAAVVGAFVLGRALDGERESTPGGSLVNIPSVPGIPRGAEEHAGDTGNDGTDGVPQRLVILGDENRQYEYYVDEKGQNYYVLVKLPIPTPIGPPASDVESVPATSGYATAQSVPSIRNNRYEYFFDTHGNAYGVMEKDHPAADLFATR